VIKGHRHHRGGGAQENAGSAGSHVGEDFLGRTMDHAGGGENERVGVVSEIGIEILFGADLLLDIVDIELNTAGFEFFHHGAKKPTMET